MKRTIIGMVVLVVVCSAAWAAYTFGYRRGYDRALSLRNGTFVGTFDALQKLRAGDVEGGTQRIEAVCFSAANTVYGDRAGSDLVANSFLDDFRRYRQTYRSNSAEWTPVELNLERKMATR